MFKKLTPETHSVKLAYSRKDAFLNIVSEGITAQYDESECASLLATIECSVQPIEDLSEFFESEFPRTHYRVAVTFDNYAGAIAEEVFA